MRAAVLRAIDRIEIEERPEPSGPLEKGEVLIELGAVGICGSDVLRFGAGKGYGFPIVLGHEMAGTVIKVAAGSKFSGGERVAVFPCLPDHADPEARRGDWAMSLNYDYMGSRSDGGMQEKLVVPERNLVRLPDEMPLVVGATVEPAAVALHGVLKFSIDQPKDALVLGAGPIGNLAAQWLRFRGVRRVLVVDIDEKKLDIAQGMGFETANPAELEDEELRTLSSNERGFDLVVEASGSPKAFETAIQVGAPRAELLLLGDISQNIDLQKDTFTQILRKEMKLLGTWNSRIEPAYANEWALVVQEIGKAIDVLSLVSKVHPFENADSVLRDLFQRTTWANKTIVAVSEIAKRETVELFGSESEICGELA